MARKKEKIIKGRSADVVNYDFIVYIIIAFFSLLWCLALTIKYISFGYNDWDLAFFNQGMWNLSRGAQFCSLFNNNFFGNHANLIALIFVPLYKIFPSALFLIYLKIVFFSAAGYVIYLIGKRVLGAGWGLFFIIVYFLYGPLASALIYEFDWEVVAVLLIPLIFYFYHLKNFRYFIIASILLLLSKENMPLYIFMLGVFSVIIKRGKRWCIWPLLLSLSWFIISIFIFVPHFSIAKQHLYWSHYPVLNQGVVEVLKFLFIPLNIDFIYKLFSPLAFLSFLRPDILLLGAPFFLQHMLSSQLSEHTIYFNYNFSLVPFIFISAILAVKFFTKENPIFLISRKFIACLILVCVLFSAKAFWPGFVSSIYRGARDAGNPARWEMCKKIPSDASVLANFSFLPELSGRRDVFALHDVYARIHYSDYYRILSAEYALIDFNDPFILNYLSQASEGPRVISDFFKVCGYEAIQSSGDVVLFKKNYVSDFKLFNKRQYMEIGKSQAIFIDDNIKFNFKGFEQVFKKKTVVPVKLYWYCLKPTVKNYQINFFLAQQSRTGELKVLYNIAHSACYRILPSSSWNKEDFFEENYNFVVPDLINGEYLLLVSFTDLAAADPAKLFSEKINLANDSTVAILGNIRLSE